MKTPEAAEDLVRLAWRVDQEGRPGTRDALLTLAVADSLSVDPTFAARCRALLSQRQPNHWFSNAKTHNQALGQKRVVEALAKLRAIFPPVRVERLLLRAETLRGPFTGRRLSVGQILERMNQNPTTDASREPSDVRSLPFPMPRNMETDPEGAMVALYWSILIAMAVLLNTVLESKSRDSRAA